MINKNDLNELKRIATNTYDDDKRFINRVILEIGKMDREICSLRAEISNLKEAAATS